MPLSCEQGTNQVLGACQSRNWTSCGRLNKQDSASKAGRVANSKGPAAEARRSSHIGRVVVRKVTELACSPPLFVDDGMDGFVKAFVSNNETVHRTLEQSMQLSAG